MPKIRLCIAILFVAGLVGCLCTRKISAQSGLPGLGATTFYTSNLFSLAYVGGTSNGNAFSSRTMITKPPLFQFEFPVGITNTALGTNAVTINHQVSVDNTNWLTIAVYHPTSTNALFIENYSMASNNVTLYHRAQLVTTNQTPIGSRAFIPR